MMKVKVLRTFGSKKKIYKLDGIYEVDEETYLYLLGQEGLVEGLGEQAKPETKALDKMSKKELILYAAELSIELDESMSKAEMVERLS